MYETATRPVRAPESTDRITDDSSASADPVEFEPLYAQYFSRVYRYCLRRVGNSQEAEDLTSQIFIRAFAGLSGYRGGSFAAWLFRIAHNAVANHWRGRRSHVPLEEVETLSEDDDMLEHLVNAEERQQLAHLLADLPDEARELLALKVAAGLSAKEIGAVIGKREGAVRVALYRIVRRLCDAWKKEDE